MKTWPSKDPDEVLDYGFDWEPRGLGDDVIIATTAVPQEGGVIVDSHEVSVDGKTTITWLSGGVHGQKCVILLTATTQVGRVLEQSVAIKIKHR